MVTNTPRTSLRHVARLLAMWTAAASSLAAQDTRTVREPTVPPACVTVTAVLEPVRDSTVSAGDEARLDTQRLQAAIDGCAAGHAVVLAADGEKRAFLSGALQLRPGVTLVLAARVILFASHDPRHFDATPGACGILAPGGRGCRALITADRADGSGVMGPGTINGRGWASIGASDVTWWELAEQARNTTMSQNNPRLIQTTRTNNFTLYNLTLRNGPNFHVVFERGDGFTAWGVTINTPKGARNSDGIDPSSATNVTITRSFIHTGDDNVAIKAGGGGASRNITVSRSHFYNGHGVSIGSETNGGAGAILVDDVTFDGTDNALRIKSNGSRGGLVEDVTYRNVCIRDVKAPIYMDSHYSASPERDGMLVPQFRRISARDVRIMGRGTVTLDGYDAARPLEMLFDHVIADDPTLVTVVGGNAAVRVGGRGTNLILAVPGVTLPEAAGVVPTVGSLSDCPARLIPFPGGAAPAVQVRRPAKPTPAP